VWRLEVGAGSRLLRPIVSLRGTVQRERQREREREKERGGERGREGDRGREREREMETGERESVCECVPRTCEIDSVDDPLLATTSVPPSSTLPCCPWPAAVRCMQAWLSVRWPAYGREGGSTRVRVCSCWLL
jgi:hypothetical protein